MKKLIPITEGIMYAILLFTAQINLSSCSKQTITKYDTAIIKDTSIIKDTINTPPPYPIQGLWIGTYTDPDNISEYFSFSIYPDGTISYKGLGQDNLWYFANGTWTLNGTAFSCTVVTINEPSGSQHTQTYTATFNSANGTLTNGVGNDLTTPANTSVFTLTWAN